jgi:hypothetical protein
VSETLKGIHSSLDEIFFAFSSSFSPLERGFTIAEFLI